MPDVFRTLREALVLDGALFADLGDVGVWTALQVALLAGASTMLGHVAILKLNRISGFHIATSLLFGAGILTVLHLTQAAVTWGVASLVLGRGLPLLDLLVVSMLSLAPLVWNFVTALPHLGLGIGRLLEAWSYVIFWYGVARTFTLSWYWALLFTIAGWLVMQLLSRLAHQPIGWLIARVWKLATGRPTMVTSRDILAGMPIIPVEGRPGREAAG